MSIKPSFLYGLNESHQIISPFKIVLKPSEGKKIKHRSRETKKEKRDCRKCKEEKSKVHCQEKAHEHSKKYRSQPHLNLHLLLSVSDPPTSTSTQFHFQENHKPNKTIKLLNQNKERNGKWLLYLRSASGVMYRAREENSPLPIYDNGLPIICHTTLNRLEDTNEPH